MYFQLRPSTASSNVRWNASDVLTKQTYANVFVRFDGSSERASLTGKKRNETDTTAADLSLIFTSGCLLLVPCVIVAHPLSHLFQFCWWRQTELILIVTSTEREGTKHRSSTNCFKSGTPHRSLQAPSRQNAEVASYKERELTDVQSRSWSTAVFGIRLHTVCRCAILRLQYVAWEKTPISDAKPGAYVLILWCKIG